MMKRKELKNIGTVLASEISITDSCLGLYIPIGTESDRVKAEREKFESWVKRYVKPLPGCKFRRMHITYRNRFVYQYRMPQ